MSCEHCWARAQMLGVEYTKVLARAVREEWPCTKNDLKGAKLRAGQFWNESTMSDTRVNPPAVLAEPEATRPITSEPSRVRGDEANG